MGGPCLGWVVAKRPYLPPVVVSCTLSEQSFVLSCLYFVMRMMMMIEVMVELTVGLMVW